MSYRVWEYERGGEMVRAARLVEVSGLEPPDLEVELISQLGDHVTVFVMAGELTSRDSILHIEKHGGFEILSVEPWPESGRFLTLRPWRG